MRASKSNFSANGVGCATDSNGAATEAEVLPPYANEHEGMQTRVHFNRETMQNPCFWILMGVLGTVAVGAAFVYVSNQGKGR